VTIDFDSIEDKQVTIRDRDSMTQVRLPVKDLTATLRAKMSGESFTS
jgi:glycyl-tRNA synthetase